VTVTRAIVGRRQRERRRSPAPVMPRNAMRCCDCGTIWYSRLADQLVTWAHCARCHGELHTERRQGDERRQYAWPAAHESV
jgi:uncharacterized paraquat-inducible protein A